MNFLELANKRESCRAYREEPVEREKIMACIEAARLAPSANNSQPWRFIVVDDREKTRALSDALWNKVVSSNKFTQQANAFIVVVENPAKLISRLGSKVMDIDYASIDIGLAAGMLCLAAAEQGLGSCILGWFDEKKVKELLSVPAGRRVRLVIALGYPQSDTPRAKKRKELAEIVSYNQF